MIGEIRVMQRQKGITMREHGVIGSVRTQQRVEGNRQAGKVTREKGTRTYN